MSSSISIVGHAIVSADGMIATSAGEMPKALIVDADQSAFQQALDESALVVMGRKGHKRHPNPGRKRLVLTSAVTDLQRDTVDAQATYWNPAGISFKAVLEALQIGKGVIAVTGGQRTFELFLPSFTQFHLAEVHGFSMPGGLSCFSHGHPHGVLAAQGLVPAQTRELVAPDLVTKTIWRRGA